MKRIYQQLWKLARPYYKKGRPRKMGSPSGRVDSWCELLGLLAGVMKFFPLQIISEHNRPLFSNVIRQLYDHNQVIGQEKARKLIRTLIRAWQKRVKEPVSIDYWLNQRYQEFLAMLPQE